MNKEQIKQALEMTVEITERSIKEGIEDLINRTERLTRDVKNIAQEEYYDLDKRVYNIIHEIQWSIANMNFSGLADKAAGYKAAKQQLNIVKQFESAE